MLREMIARPKTSRNERKTAERGAFEVGNVAPFRGPARHAAAPTSARPVQGSRASPASSRPRSLPSLSRPLGVKLGSSQSRSSPHSSADTTTSSPRVLAATAVTGLPCAGTQRSSWTSTSGSAVPKTSTAPDEQPTQTWRPRWLRAMPRAKTAVSGFATSSEPSLEPLDRLWQRSMRRLLMPASSCQSCTPSMTATTRISAPLQEQSFASKTLTGFWRKGRLRLLPLLRSTMDTSSPWQ